MRHLRRLVLGDVAVRFHQERGRLARQCIVWDDLSHGYGAPALEDRMRPSRQAVRNLSHERTLLASLGILGPHTEEVALHEPRVREAAQTLFLKLFQAGLAYRRGKAWFLHVRALGGRLRDTLNRLEWPASLIFMQRNWLGIAADDSPLSDWRIARERQFGVRLPLVRCVACGDVPSVQETCRCPRCLGSARPYRESLDPRFVALAGSGAVYSLPGREWHPTSLYVADSDRTHILYARFLRAALHLVEDAPDVEPYALILAPGTVRINGFEISAARSTGPDLLALNSKYGGDAVRLALLAGARPPQDLPWRDEDVSRMAQRLDGLVKWANRASCEAEGPHSDSLHARLEQAFPKIAAALERQAFSEAAESLLAVLEFCLARAAEGAAATSRAVAILAHLTAPFVPQTSARLMEVGHKAGMTNSSPWRIALSTRSLMDEVTIVVQVDGRVRDRLRCQPGTDEAVVLERALQSLRVRAHLPNSKPHRIVYVPDRVLNLVSKA